MEREIGAPAGVNRKGLILSEIRRQGMMVAPLVMVNLAWFARISITTAFLGRLGSAELAGGTLGLTFANITGFSVLTGLCGSMEPICGQACGAKNYKLLHKTLLMAMALLLAATLPISLLWLFMDKILVCFGQQKAISEVAKSYVRFLLPDLAITAFISPVKAYLSAQGMNVPILISSVLGLVIHFLLSFAFSKARGLEGVAMAVWGTDLFIAVLLGVYVLLMEKQDKGRWEEGGWLGQELCQWVQLLRLSGPCCMTTCLEWWCYEILILLAGRLNDPKRAVSVLAIVLNFDYLLYALMLSMATSVSARVSNELGANQPRAARMAALVALSMSLFGGVGGGSIMVLARRAWGLLYTHDTRTLEAVKNTMPLMALVDVLNFPLTVCGGVLRATARPWRAFSATVGGFYLLSVPLGVVLAFLRRLGLAGLLLGLLVGAAVCALLLTFMVLRLDWRGDAHHSQRRLTPHPTVSAAATDFDTVSVT